MDKQQLGQSAMEFMTLVGFLLLVFTVVTAVIAGDTAHLNKNQIIVSGNDLALKIQKEILLAARVSDGYERNFTLSQKVGNKEYSIIINGTEVVVRTELQDFWKTIPHVNGTLKKGSNQIRKQDGIIYIN